MYPYLLRTGGLEIGHGLDLVLGDDDVDGSGVRGQGLKDTRQGVERHLLGVAARTLASEDRVLVESLFGVWQKVGAVLPHKVELQKNACKT